jgi:hypothetical protein
MSTVTSKLSSAFGVTLACLCVSLNAEDIWKLPFSKNGPCEYHPIPYDSRAMVTSIPTSSQNLRPDGLGAYWDGADTLRSYLGHNGVAYNFYTYWPETCDEPLPHKVRSVEIHLDSPEPGAKNLGIVRDHSAMLHVFPQKGAALKDMGVGEIIPARRVLLRFHQEGKIYFLRMGSETFVPPLPGGYMEILPGQNTTTARITRESQTKWKITAAPGSLTRLSIWGPKPVDLGLYRFSFEIDLRTQRTGL